MISTESKSYGWIAGVPAGMQELPSSEESSEESESIESEE
jgi:hypothetical protein